jgi:proteasome accessory factor C
MDKFDRIFALHQILASRRTPISHEDLLAKLECSKSTLHRAINVLKNYLHAPVEFDATFGGYRYAGGANAQAFQLPGLWFTPAELQALSVLRRLLKDVGAGLLEDHLAPITKRLDELTDHKRLNLSEAGTRLRFPAIAARRPGDAFQLAASATLQRKQLWMEYHGRRSGRHSERTVSPQRLTHYRESWYLDAWDEDKQQLRMFSVDRIGRITVLDKQACNVPESELDNHFASSYGIFSGNADKLAILHFDEESARWVADEEWHPEQQGHRLEDGSYELRIPYSSSVELVMDILRHGMHVKVLDPPELVNEVVRQLRGAQAQYPTGE